MNEGTIEARGGGKDTLYNIMEKFRKGASPLANTHFSAGTAVPDSSGTVPEQDCFRNWAVPERNPVIATAEGPFRNKDMISGDGIPVPEAQPVEAPKVEQDSIPRGFPLTDVPEDVALPCLVDDGSGSERWLLRVDRLGNGRRLFHTSRSKTGRADWTFEEPDRKAPEKAA